MDIASSLVKNNKAIINSNIDFEINATGLNDLLNYINQIKYGQKKFCSSLKFKLTDLANCVRNHYETIAKKIHKFTLKVKFLIPQKI